MLVWTGLAESRGDRDPRLARPGPLSSPDSVREPQSIQIVTIRLRSCHRRPCVRPQLERQVRRRGPRGFPLTRTRPSVTASAQSRRPVANCQPGHRIHLHDVRRGAPGVSRARRRTELHRKVGPAPPPIGRGHAPRGRSTGHGPRPGAPAVRAYAPRRAPPTPPRPRRTYCAERTRRDDTTCRPRRFDAGPGSRRSGQTRHSCRRCIRTVMIPGPAPAGRGSQTGRRWTCQHTDVPGSSGPVWSWRWLPAPCSPSPPHQPCAAETSPCRPDSVTVNAGSDATVTVQVTPREGDRERSKISLTGLPRRRALRERLRRDRRQPDRPKVHSC